MSKYIVMWDESCERGRDYQECFVVNSLEEAKNYVKVNLEYQYGVSIAEVSTIRGVSVKEVTQKQVVFND